SDLGTGTVQSLVKLSSGELKLTIAKFYRISGGSTQSRGISPDIKFPDVFDIQQIGESELPESLPWDTIEPVFYDYDPGINKALDRLNERHQARIAANADFIFTSALAGYLKQKQGETLISLNRDIRKKQKDQDETWQLNLENQRRKAKGQPVLEKLEEDPAEADPDMPFDHDKKDKEPDAFVTEGGWILLDWMELSRQNMNPQNLMTTKLADESFLSPGRSASDQ
ncbi:MAG: carboxy terminal-processing peptidase, partial [Desulfobacterales bacterium]|nr:carboxy terminal-processing peptidase [Desulfobacterales bacterium]